MAEEVYEVTRYIAQQGNMIKRLFSPHRDKLVLLIFPIALISINSNWIFTPATNYIPDPWFYLGYFRYFYEYAPAYPSNVHYFVERLTWNVPGYYLYQIFPPLQANYVLHLGVYYVAIYSLYGTLKLTFNHRTALISSLLMGSYPWFMRAAGWDYTDGTGIAHMLLLIFLITLAQHSSRWRVWLICAGAVHASLLITNLFWISFSPSWMLYFLIQNSKTKAFRPKELILAALYFFMGNLLTFTLVGLFYYQVTGNYFFLANSLRFLVLLPSDERNKQEIITIYGHMRPFWHVLPAIIALMTTAHMFLFKRTKTIHSVAAIYVLFIAAYGWLIFWHFYSIPLLSVFTYSSYVIPAVFLLLGAVLSRPLTGFTEKQFYGFALSVVLLAVLPYILLIGIPAIQELQGNLFLITGASLLILIMWWIPRKWLAIFAIGFGFSSLFFLVGQKAYVYIPDTADGRDNFLAIMTASQFIDSYYPQHSYRGFRLWFRSDEHYDTFFSLASLYLYPWGSALGKPHSRGQPPRQLSLVENDILEAGDDIVIISSEPQPDELLREANQSAEQQNARLRLIATKTIQQGSTRFFLYFTEVSELQ